MNLRETILSYKKYINIFNYIALKLRGKMKYSVMDLFCGAGGLSLGFEQTDKFESKLHLKKIFQHKQHIRKITKTQLYIAM